MLRSNGIPTLHRPEVWPCALEGTLKTHDLTVLTVQLTVNSFYMIDCLCLHRGFESSRRWSVNHTTRFSSVKSYSVYLPQRIHAAEVNQKFTSAVWKCQRSKKKKIFLNNQEKKEFKTVSTKDENDVDKTPSRFETYDRGLWNWPDQTWPALLRSTVPRYGVSRSCEQ